MNKKILIIGLGSIGKRHLKNLVSLDYQDVSIVTKSDNKTKGFESFMHYSSIDKACGANKFDIAIIATPTANHITDLTLVLNHNIKNIYLEKPISNSLKGLDKVIERLSGVNIVVGYDLHFDPGLIFVKKMLDDNKIGKVVSFIAEVGQYLPDWREVDYRNTMSASKEKGGGVMLDLVHEFDYINWLFGPIVQVIGKNNKISNLEIDTEDVSVNILEASSGAIGSIHLDYMQKELSRSCKVIGNNGSIIWDYANSPVRYMTHSNPSWSVFDYSDYKRNDRFKTTMKSFLEFCNGVSDNRLVDFNEAVKSLQLVVLLKQSNSQGSVVDI
jgi:predicted dehydrogenase